MDIKTLLSNFDVGETLTVPLILPDIKHKTTIATINLEVCFTMLCTLLDYCPQVQQYLRMQDSLQSQQSDHQYNDPQHSQAGSDCEVIDDTDKPTT